MLRAIPAPDSLEWALGLLLNGAAVSKMPALVAESQWEAKGLNALGTHVMLDLKGCNPQLLDDLSYIRA